MSVARCMAEVDAEEFTAWRAFDRYEPIGREAEAAAMTHSLLWAGLVRQSGGKLPTMDPWDFMPAGTIKPVKSDDGADREAAAMERQAEAMERAKKG